jgi:hypothetical protein
MPLHSDLSTFEDKLGRERLVQDVARAIAVGQPPLVFGIHGDWGSGKTSFLCQLEHELTGACTNHPEAKECKRHCEEIDNVFTVWLEAWRYQYEPAPVVALLQEICRQLPKHEKIQQNLKKWSAVLAKGIFGAVEEVSAEMTVGALGTGGKLGAKIKNPLQTIGAEAKSWNEDHLSGRLTTDRIRELLTETIEELLGDKGRPVCVLIDDLDRCEPAAALRLLEGIKVHLSLPHCVFVLGVNLRQIEQAIAPLLPGAAQSTDSAAKHAEAAEYLEKLCTHVWKLPFPSREIRGHLLELWLADPPEAPKDTIHVPPALKHALVATANEYDCLPANPRKIKGLANTIRQLFHRGWPEAAPGAAHPVPSNEIPAEADRLLVAASIEHFHSELLRYLQTYPEAWEELIKWANGKSALPAWSDLRCVLDDLRLSAGPRSAADSKATPSAEPQELIFPDPVHVSVFRIHKLLRAATDPSPSGRNSVNKQSLTRYLALAETRLKAASPPPAAAPPPAGA